MSSLFNVSKGASLALHAAGLLARSQRPLQASRIAAALGVSRAHLSKVLPRLVKAGLIAARPGPGGGFSLARPAKEVTLKQVYEAAEGPIDTSLCPFGLSICKGEGCLLRDEFGKASVGLLAFMARARLSDIRMDYVPALGEGSENDGGKTED